MENEATMKNVLTPEYIELMQKLLNTGASFGATNQIDALILAGQRGPQVTQSEMDLLTNMAAKLAHEMTKTKATEKDTKVE